MRVKSLLLVFVIILVAAFGLVFGACSSDSDTNGSQNPTNQPQTGQSFSDIFPAQAYELIQQNTGSKSFVIIDIRTPDEFNSAHIKDAQNIDYYASDFSAKLTTLDKENVYLIYCASGNRSGKAHDVMYNLGFQTVYNMEGGFNKWKSEDLPYVS